MLKKKERQNLAERKLKYVRKLFEELPERSSTEVNRKVQKKFGSGTDTALVLNIMHEIRGTEPRKVPRKKLPRKAQSKPKPKPKPAPKAPVVKKDAVEAPEPQYLSVVSLEAKSSVEVLVRALVRAMREEAIESLTVHADGRGRAYRLVGKDLHVEL